MQRPKIIAIHPNLNVKGGAERKLLLILSELAKQRIHVELWVHQFDPSNTFKEFLDPRIKIHSSNKKSKFSWLASSALRLLLSNPNLVLVSNAPAHFIAMPFKFLFFKKPVIWICNEVQALLSEKKSFLWKVYFQIDRLGSRLFDLVIGNSDFTASSIHSFYDIHPKVIRSGVEVKEKIRFENISEKIQYLAQKPFVFSLSRIEKHKNILMGVKLAEKFPKISIYQAGKGPFADQLDKKISNYEYLGPISEDEKFFLYRKAKAFIFLPTAEPLGVTIMESLSQNTPVLAYNNGGPKETVLAGKNGLLANNNEDYIRNFQEIITWDKVRPKWGRQYIQEKFSNERMVNDFKHAIMEVLV